VLGAELEHVDSVDVGGAGGGWVGRHEGAYFRIAPRGWVANQGGPRGVV
jgi:hypothetical protein